VKIVSPDLRSIVTKYNQSPAAGFTVASIASDPGELIGPGGSPLITYVLNGLASTWALET
jgi:hypothetical protein